MRLELLDANGYSHVISSSDPVTIGRWLAETIALTQLSPAYPGRLIAWPGLLPDGSPDWVADKRVMGRHYEVTGPRSMLEALQSQLEEVEALQRSDAAAQDG